VKAAIWQAGLKNNEIASSLKPLANNETMKEVRAAMETSMKVSDHMKDVRREAIDINNDVYKLKQKLSDLEPDWESKLGMAAENGKFGCLEEELVDEILVLLFCSF
jgi:laminin, alpha 1/2